MTAEEVTFIHKKRICNFC